MKLAHTTSFSLSFSCPWGSIPPGTLRGEKQDLDMQHTPTLGPLLTKPRASVPIIYCHRTDLPQPSCINHCHFIFQHYFFVDRLTGELFAPLDLSWSSSHLEAGSGLPHVAPSCELGVSLVETARRWAAFTWLSAQYLEVVSLKVARLFDFPKGRNRSYEVSYDLGPELVPCPHIHASKQVTDHPRFFLSRYCTRVDMIP